MANSKLSKWFNGITTDRVVSLSAMFVSILTLITFVYQTRLMKVQSQLSVMPHLTILRNSGPDPAFIELELINQGVGPAIIEDRKLFHEGKAYDMELIEFIRQAGNILDSLGIVSYASTNAGSVIPAGESIILFKIEGDERKVVMAAEYLESLDLGFEIIYRSIYNKRWKIDAQNDFPIELN